MGGDETGYQIIFRGFKLSVPLLDAFLAAHGQECFEDQDFCFPANPKARDHPITKLLYETVSEVDSNPNPASFRLVMPKVRHYDRTKTVYIAYAWVVVYVQRELDMDKDFPREVPAGFEHLRKAILSVADQVPEGQRSADEGKMGFFTVREDAHGWDYSPQAVEDRFTQPNKCDICGEGPFPTKGDAEYPYDFAALMAHRRKAHGLEEYNPLPEA